MDLVILRRSPARVYFLYASSVWAEPVALEEVAAFHSQQVTGVTASAKGRVFVNFPFWSDDHTVSVAEVIEGKLKPFPDDAWNAKDGPPPPALDLCAERSG